MLYDSISAKIERNSTRDTLQLRNYSEEAMVSANPPTSETTQTEKKSTLLLADIATSTNSVAAAPSKAKHNLIRAISSLIWYPAVTNQGYWEKTWLRRLLNPCNEIRKRSQAYIRRFSSISPPIWPKNDKKFYLNIVGVFICLLGVRALNVLGPVQLGIVVDALGRPGSPTPFPQIIIYVLYTWSAENGLVTITYYFWGEIERSLGYSILTAAYNHIMCLSSDYHDARSSSKLYNALHQDNAISNLLKVLLLELIPFLTDILTAFGYVYTVFGFEMLVIVAAIACLYVVTLVHYLSKKSGLDQSANESSEDVTKHLYDTIGSWWTVSYFNRLGYERERYTEILESQMGVERERYRVYRLSYIVEGLVLRIGLLAACCVAAAQISRKRRNIGDMAMLVAYWRVFTNPLEQLATSSKVWRTHLIAAEDILKLLETSPSVSNGKSTFNVGHGTLEFNEVSFSYDQSPQTLKHINLTINPGQKIALVGPSGAGKSTFLKLIFRLHDPTSGSIKLDGQDLKDLTLESFREYIGICPQKATMFNTTIVKNIRYSKLDASDTEVIDACKAAAIHDQIMSFENNYETVVGEHGVKLSGGQLQRLAIARAILKNPMLLLLDEPTSSVDTDTERHIQKALSSLTTGRTTIVVAHRLSTIVDADRILVIDNGIIAEEGSFEDLLKAKGKFYGMWSEQAATPFVTHALLKESEKIE